MFKADVWLNNSQVEFCKRVYDKYSDSQKKVEYILVLDVPSAIFEEDTFVETPEYVDIRIDKAGTWSGWMSNSRRGYWDTAGYSFSEEVPFKSLYSPIMLGGE